MSQAISLTDEPRYRRNTLENLMNPIIETENFIATPVETILNAKQKTIIERFKAMSDACPNESSVEITPIDGLEDVVVQLVGEGSGKFPSYTSATFVLGARGGIKHAKYRYSPMFSDSEELSGKSAEEKIKHADIFIFSTY